MAKEKKSFFTRDNRLNKGYARRPYVRHKNSDFGIIGKRLYSMLPTPELLDYYEEIHPGTLKSILEMTQVEQKHYFDLEKSQVALDKTVMKCGAISVVAVCITTMILSIMFSIVSGLSFAAFAFVSMGVSCVILSLMSSCKISFKKHKQHDVAPSVSQ